MILSVSLRVFAQDQVVFPLKASADHHYLVDQQGNPFFVQGDSPWHLAYKVNRDEVKRYLDDRISRGFTSVMIQITPDLMEKGGNQPNLYGEYVFRDADVSRPNENFFIHVDSVIEEVARRGLAIFFFPMYTGCCHDGWQEMLEKSPNTVEKCRHYGRWVARRYYHIPNIIWVSGGDHNETPESLAVAEGIADVDSVHLHTFHTGSPGSATERLPDARWLTLGTTYTYYPGLDNVGMLQYHVYGLDYHECIRNHRIPFVMIESSYEKEREETTQFLRRQAYWAMLSGACGQFYGHRDIWQMNRGWEKFLDYTGCRSMTILGKFFKSLDWYRLIPDWGHNIVVSGRGTFNPGITPGGEDYATVAASPDGRLMVAYLPTYRKVTVQMERLSGSLQARWFDPSSGKYYDAGNFDNKGMQDFTPPADKNSQGFEDWILVLQSNN